jgi:type I restriction enzyme S subunit
MGAAGQNGFHDKALATGPGIVVGRSGASFGKVHYCEKDYWPHNTGLYVTDFRGNHPRFAFYFLKALDFSRYNSGSAQPSLNRNFIYPIEVRIPPPDEQRAIAHILGTLDDKIELNRRMNETLEAMARALFKSWFVDFDPVRAKAEGRDPGLPKHLADLFPDRLVESELGEIPEKWEVAPLSEVVEVNPTRALRKGVEAPYLDMANMPTRGHSADDVVDRAFGSGTRFVSGDTLLARITPCLENGKTAFVDFLGDGEVGWGSTEYIVLRPKPPLPEEYAYCLARSAEFREFAILSMTGTSGRQRVPAESLAHFRVAVPPRPIAEAFGRAVEPGFTRASAAVRESRTLIALRDALLPKLISGELRGWHADRVAHVSEDL